MFKFKSVIARKLFGFFGAIAVLAVLFGPAIYYDYFTEREATELPIELPSDELAKLEGAFFRVDDEGWVSANIFNETEWFLFAVTMEVTVLGSQGAQDQQQVCELVADEGVRSMEISRFAGDCELDPDATYQYRIIAAKPGDIRRHREGPER